MEIMTAKTAGFCFGVKRAIDIAFQIAREKRKGVYTLGPIIHNPQVVDKAQRKRYYSNRKYQSKKRHTGTDNQNPWNTTQTFKRDFFKRL